jgi:hypothetical protein
MGIESTVDQPVPIHYLLHLLADQTQQQRVPGAADPVGAVAKGQTLTDRG